MIAGFDVNWGRFEGHMYWNWGSIVMVGMAWRGSFESYCLFERFTFFACCILLVGTYGLVTFLVW